MPTQRKIHTGGTLGHAHAGLQDARSEPSGPSPADEWQGTEKQAYLSAYQPAYFGVNTHKPRSVRLKLQLCIDHLP